MTQPTAVQLRELFTKWRSGADGCVRDGLIAHAYAMRHCATELESLLAAAEPAPEPQGSGDAWRACYSAVIHSLAAMVNVHTPDRLFDLDAIPREPIMEHVMRIHESLDTFGRALTPKPSTPQASNDREQAALYRMFRAIVDAGGPETIARHGVERGSDEWVQAVRGGLLAIEHRHHPERFDEPLYPTTPQAESVPVVGGEADRKREVLMDQSLRERTLKLLIEVCGAWSDVKDGGDINEAKCQYASAKEKYLRAAINEMADLSRPAPQADGEGGGNDPTLSFESALSTLIGIIAPDLDSGDVLDDAKQAAKIASKYAADRITKEKLTIRAHGLVQELQAVIAERDHLRTLAASKAPATHDYPDFTSEMCALVSALYAHEEAIEAGGDGVDVYDAQVMPAYSAAMVAVQRDSRARAMRNAALRPTSTTRAGEG